LAFLCILYLPYASAEPSVSPFLIPSP
jgi:hypothetical protein